MVKLSNLSVPLTMIAVGVSTSDAFVSYGTRSSLGGLQIGPNHLNSKVKIEVPGLTLREASPDGLRSTLLVNYQASNARLNPSSISLRMSANEDINEPLDGSNQLNFDQHAIDALCNTKTEDQDGIITAGHLLANVLDSGPMNNLQRLGVTSKHVRRAAGLADAETKVNPDLNKLNSPNPNAEPTSDVQRYSTTELFDSLDQEMRVILSTLEQSPNVPLTACELRDAITAFANEFPDSNIGAVMMGAIRISFAEDRQRRLQGLRPSPIPSPIKLPSEVKVVRSESAPDRIEASNSKKESASVEEWRSAQKLARPTRTIDSLCEDLTALAADGEVTELVGRDSEMIQVAIALRVKKKGGALVVGPPGVGKTAMIEALAKKIVEGELPGLKNHRLVALPIANLVAGTNLRGDLEKKVQEVIEEAKYQPIILFMDEFHTIIGAGQSQGGTADLADMFKSARGLKIIGCTTEREFSEKFNDPAFERRFELVKLSEPDRDATKYILESVVPHLSEHHNVTYDPSAIEATLTLADRFVSGHSPDKHISLMDYVGASAPYKNITTVDADTIAARVEESTGVPVSRVQSTEGHSPSEIADALKAHVIGQDEAIDAVTTAIFQARAGVNPNRPAVIVFTGPTGTGKTELAKAIAKVDGRHMIRIDMETVKNPSTLKGAEPGYIGHERDGILTGPQKLHPYSLVLFDEIEKAPDEVLKTLLGLLDEGEMTDSRGEHVAFNNAIIIFTTNFGAHNEQLNKRPFGFDIGLTPREEESSGNRARAEKIKHQLGERLGPEYVNRFQIFVLFNELTEQNMVDITRLHLTEKIGKELSEAKNLKLSFHPSLVNAIAKEGYDPKSGAREVRRICDKLIRTSVARLILEHPELGKIDQQQHLVFTLSDDFHLHIGIKGLKPEITYEMMAVSSDLRQIDIR